MQQLIETVEKCLKFEEREFESTRIYDYIRFVDPGNEKLLLDFPEDDYLLEFPEKTIKMTLSDIHEDFSNVPRQACHVTLEKPALQNPTQETIECQKCKRIGAFFELCHICQGMGELPLDQREKTFFEALRELVALELVTGGTGEAPGNNEANSSLFDSF